MAVAKKIIEKKIREQSLMNLAEKLSLLTGKDFFRQAVKYLADILGMDFVFTGKLIQKKDETVRILAMCEKGSIIDNFEYSLTNTPCENVIGKKICSYPRNVQNIFPKDYLLKDMDIESYVGIPLFDTNGGPLGILAVLHRKEIKEITTVESILRIFAVRTSTEMERLKIEEDLKNSEARYRAVVEHQEELIVRWKPDGTITFANSSFIKYFKLNSCELSKTDFFSLTKEEDRHLIQKKLSSFSTQNTPEIDERRAVKNDGNTSWIQWVDIGIFNDNGDISEIQSVGRDISEKKEIEKQLIENEERLNLLFEYAPDGYYLTDQAGNFIDGNHQAEAISGYYRDELRGVNFIETNMLSSDQVYKAIEMLGKTTLGMPAGPTEFVLKKKDGTFIPVEIRAFPIKIKNKTMVLNIARDIRERKNTEEKLIESENRFRRLAENISEGLTVIEKGKMTYCNEQLCKIYGISRDEVTRMTLAEHIVPEEKEDVMEIIQNSIKSGDKHFVIKYHILRKNGERCYIRKSVNITTDEEGNINSYVVTTDITDKEKEIEV